MRDDDTIPETYSRFPRTLDEAFRTTRYADPVERHGPTGYPPLWWALVGLCAAAAVTLSWVLA